VPALAIENATVDCTPFCPVLIAVSCSVLLGQNQLP